MRAQMLRLGPVVLGALLLMFSGCGGGDSTGEPGGAGGGGGTGGTTDDGGPGGVGGSAGIGGMGGSGATGGTGGTGATGGTGGSGGTGTGGTAGTGGAGGSTGSAHPGMDLVAGAVVCSSPQYKAILTLGQSPGGNTTMSSPNYRIIGGVVGATQSP
jgi:hypothetical protein